MNARNTNRLLLGERQAVIQEARRHGGVFIDPHPDALRAMQENNIDPYIIYEQALLQRIEARISRIDFIQVNLSELLEEWKLKPEAQAPIYIRLALWLKTNARAHGYEQSANSWVLKS